MFFGLDPFTLKLVFNLYEQLYGAGPRTYAEKTYQRWKDNAVEMSVEVRGRLLGIVPRLLSFDQRYELISKLWSRLLTPQRMSITITPADGVDEAVQTVAAAVEAIRGAALPDAVQQRLEWLADSDAQAAQELLRQVKMKEHEVICRHLTAELTKLLEVTAEHSQHQVAASKELILPGAVVTIHVQQSTSQTRSRRMTDNKPFQERPQENGPIQPVKKNALAPITNSDNILDEALRHMSSEGQQRLMDKAGAESLRLKVKQQEGQVDGAIVDDKLERVSDQARRLGGNPNIEFTLEDEHRSEHGHTTIKIQNKKRSFREGCFIATACYDASDHPVVRILRHFRDHVLARNAAGRAFVRTYYCFGPWLAAALNEVPILKSPLRVVLAKIAHSYAKRHR
jgi:hypothetical protein